MWKVLKPDEFRKLLDHTLQKFIKNAEELAKDHGYKPATPKTDLAKDQTVRVALKHLKHQKTHVYAEITLDCDFAKNYIHTVVLQPKNDPDTQLIKDLKTVLTVQLKAAFKDRVQEIYF